MVNEENNEIPDEKVYFSWEVQERLEHERSRIWYVVMGAVGVALLLYSIYTVNFLFAIMVILVGFIIIIRDYSPNPKLPVIFTNKAAVLGKAYFPYKNFKSFYIIYEPPQVKKLYLEFKSIRPDLSLDLKDQDPLKLREFLLQVMSENIEKEDESTMDVIERFLKL